MQILTSEIASWEEGLHIPEDQLQSQDVIATETQQSESPEWEKCVDALLAIWNSASSLEDPPPNQASIEAALSWIFFLRKRFPYSPPTCIIPEPSGGLIVERRGVLPNGKIAVCELTFHNTGRAERTDYFDERIINIAALPWRPTGESA